MDGQTIAYSLVYLGTGVLTTVTHQVLVYQGAGAPSTMLVPFFNYCGMALVEIVPARCGGLDSGPATKSPTRHAASDAVQTVTGGPAILRGEPGPGRRALPHGESQSDGESGGADTAAVAAGAPDVAAVDQAPNASSSVVLCPAGARAGPCMPRALQARLSRPVPTWAVIAMSVALDLLGFSAGCVGVALAGSGVYQVVHASVVIFAALFAWLLRGRAIRGMQWAAIALITAGLAISAAGAGGGAPSHSLEVVPRADDAEGGPTGQDTWPRRLSGAGGGGPGSDSASGMASGIVFTLAGAILYGLNYSLLDALSSSPTAPPQARLAGSIGSGAATAVAVWVMVHTVPNWEELVGQPTAVAGGSAGVVLVGFGLVALSALAHSLAYFRLLRGHGAVVIGVLQALRAAAVFLVGSALFCGYQESQCLTMPRAVAAVLVAIGVVVFASSKARVVTTPTEKKDGGGV